ncbi:hypothetical protein [Paenibacillus sp. P32E]|uniref:hypothetical protein n=1 Tax=Paenibacillus sp. P32E TaxID=1349434 RepID=UPI00093ED712|nr:hypothetical protein [Paenibacillus sp. P32E]OKP91398.1 hypothetical protein A3848_09850 [Paenibacillus sp. P32E]
MPKIILTKHGVERFREELESIKSVRLPGAEDKLEVVKKHGGNIKDATDERDFYKNRITYLENALEKAKVLDI